MFKPPREVIRWLYRNVGFVWGRGVYFVDCSTKLGSRKMTSFKGYHELTKVDGSTTDDFTKIVYDQWAKTYDEETISQGYVAHETSVKVFDTELKKCFGEKRFGLKILDAGAGTGFVGEHLKGIGYTNIDALDISQEMLDIARTKNIYKKLICAPISDERINEIESDDYDGVISSGTITVGHVKPHGLDEILRLVRDGGLICFTLRQDAYDTDSYGYREKMEELVEKKKWEQVSKDLIQYHTSAQRAALGTCYVFTYKAIKH